MSAPEFLALRALVVGLRVDALAEARALTDEAEDSGLTGDELVENEKCWHREMGRLAAFDDVLRLIPEATR